MNHGLVPRLGLVVAMILAVNLSPLALAQSESFSLETVQIVEAVNTLTEVVNQTREDFDYYSPEMIEAIDGLTTKINKYGPEFVDIGDNLTEVANTYAPRFLHFVNDISDSIQDISKVAKKQAPEARKSLETGADALKTLASIGTWAQQKKVSILLSLTGAMALGGATGVIVGLFARDIMRDHIFTRDKKKNVFCVIFFAGRWLYHQTRTEPLEPS